MGEKGEGPEYLTVASFGMGCDVPDYTAISHFHRLCNDYSMDLCEAGEGFVPDMKGIVAAFCENRATAVNLLGICTFLPSTQPLGITLGLLAQAYQAMTGVEMTEAGLLRCGERAYNLEKAFNSRLGLRRSDDRVCQRWLQEPATWGTGQGMKAQDYLEGLLDEYYR